MPSPAAKGQLVFVGAVVGILALVVAGYVLLLEPEAPAPVVMAAAAVPESPEARLATADGTVEIRLRGSDDWRAAIAGEVIAPGADVRTGEASGARLTYGPGVAAEMHAQSLIQLDEVGGPVTRFIVGEGLVVIDVDEKLPKPRRVQVAARGSDAVVETQGGRITMMNDGAGRVQTAVTRGAASVSAAGETVQLAPGQQSSVAPGSAPSAPSAIPTSLLLKVRWPEKETTKRKQVIRGTTNPGSRVRVGPHVVTAGRDGRFEAVVELAEGRNRILVQAVDVVGRREQDQSEIELDTQAPPLAVETDPSMWKKSSQR